MTQISGDATQYDHVEITEKFGSDIKEWEWDILFLKSKPKVCHLASRFGLEPRKFRL